MNSKEKENKRNQEVSRLLKLAEELNEKMDLLLDRVEQLEKKKGK